MIKFNMNDFVYFKPTKLGVQVYTDYYINLNMPKHTEIPTLKVDEDGFSYLQFHEFICIYGHIVSNYFFPQEPVFESYNIYFKENDI